VLIEVLIKTADEVELKTLEENKVFLTKLAKLEKLTFGTEIEKVKGAGFRVAKNSEIYVPLAGLLDVEAETTKINTQIAKLEKDLAKVTGKLSNEKFVSKAPAHIIDREKKIQKEYEDKLAKLRENLEAFGG